jgi:hypothetical protein
MTDPLRDLIANTLSDVQAPADQDNLDEDNTVVEDDQELEVELEDTELEDTTEDDEVENDEDIEEEGEDSEDESNPDLDKVYTVKVDGEEVEVTLKEALAGYQRQADYTRKAQSVAEAKELLEQEIAQYSESLEQLDTLDSAWEEDPITVLSHFTSNTENPTQAIALLIKDLAGKGLLENEFLQIFGITPDVQQAWAKDSEVNTLRRQVSASQTEKARAAEEAETEKAIQEAIAEYDRQIDDIIADEGMKLTKDQRLAFRSQLAGYARDNDLTNLKAAFKAMKFEEVKQKEALAKKAKERAKNKKSAGAVARSGSPAAGTPVEDTKDLRSVIMNAMKENGI